MLVIGPMFHTLDAGINIVMTLEFLSLFFMFVPLFLDIP